MLLVSLPPIVGHPYPETLFFLTYVARTRQTPHAMLRSGQYPSKCCTTPLYIVSGTPFITTHGSAPLSDCLIPAHAHSPHRASSLLRQLCLRRSVLRCSSARTYSRRPDSVRASRQFSCLHAFPSPVFT